MQSRPFVFCDRLVKIYKVANLEVVALQGVDLGVARGEVMALVGPSGSGKSTLLNLIGGLDAPSAGTVWVGGLEVPNMDPRQRETYKRETVGFVWQQPGRNLLPYLSALENVEMPMLLNRRRGAERRRRALELLELVGLAERASFRPHRLSGGEQQRVALAVALANNPPLLLADEPTGQIDAQSARQVLAALDRIRDVLGTTIVIVTHDALVVDQVDRVVTLSDGRTSTEIRRRDPDGRAIPEQHWVILDRSGRLQLPRPLVRALGLQDHVRVQLEPRYLSVWPKEGAVAAEEAAALPCRPTELAAARWAPEGQPAAVAAVGLSRVYEAGAEPVWALRDVSLSIAPGSLVVVVGPSGSGKTTLLNLLAGLDEPTAGTVYVGGRDLDALSADEKIELRRRQIGFVHQTIGLLPFLSVEENVGVPLRLLCLSNRERRARTDEALRLVGLSDRARHRAYELSGGEQQRVAIARSLVGRPALILADEPTGQLDSLTGAGIIALLREVVERTGITVLIASHDPQVYRAADRVYELRAGVLVGV
ncbi:MAG: ABC transporter ATP-binding protein [Chloroflexia bacterium]|nr:ABC transporter ATP-binding protein [Chloroflexia bacterium]